jgi:1-deoxy-D-xylulose-5-phosphate synthase
VPVSIPDRLVEHGTPKELHRECAYDAQAVANTVREMMRTEVAVKSKVVN